MERIKKERSILGAIHDLSNILTLMLVIPIISSLFCMLFYAWKYDSAIQRIGRITNLKTVVVDEIPERAWYIVSGKETFPKSTINKKIMEVDKTIGEVAARTEEENRLSLIVAERTMETLRNYVDKLRDNIASEVPVVENEKVLAEIRDVAALVNSMLNEYITLEITSTSQMSKRLGVITLITAALEVFVVIIAMLVREKSMKNYGYGGCGASKPYYAGEYYGGSSGGYDEKKRSGREETQEGGASHPAGADQSALPI